MGYGLAGLTRRFLVYPSFCIWPRSLVTIALNGALHKGMHANKDEALRHAEAAMLSVLQMTTIP